MSKIKQIMAATLAMAAMAESGGMFAPGLVGDYHEDPYADETPEERKRRLHKMYGSNAREQEFIIKGEAIMTKDRKTAMKIYANRHQETKKNKKRKH